MIGAVAAAAAMTGWRVDYVGNWSGRAALYSVDASGRGGIDFVARDDHAELSSALPSPDGRRIVFETSDQTTWLARANGTDARVISRERLFFAAWSPDSRSLAYVTWPGSSPELHVLRPDGTERVSPLALTQQSAGIVWRRGRVRVLDHGESPDGTYTTQETYQSSRGNGLEVTRVATHTVVATVFPQSGTGIWSPDGRLFAYFDRAGLEVLDASTGHTRLLTTGHGSALTWRPDSRALAYDTWPADPFFPVVRGDIRMVTLDGHVRVVARATAPNVGIVTQLAWTRRAPIAYRPPPQLPGVYTVQPVQYLAAAGPRVAYAACNVLHVWTPATGAVVERSTEAECASIPAERLTSIALGDGGVAYSLEHFGISKWWSAWTDPLTAPPRQLVAGAETCCTSYPVVAGGGGTLAYADRTGDHRTHTWTVRVPGGQPLMSFQQDANLPVGLDVDGDRVLVAHDGAVDVVQTENGGTLFHLDLSALDPTLPLWRPPDAQLAGGDVAVHVRDHVDVYSTATHSVVGTFPLAPTDILQDGRADEVAYVDHDEVYVRRVTEGVTTAVAPGDLARFVDGGLAVANGARVAVVPFT